MNLTMTNRNHWIYLVTFYFGLFLFFFVFLSERNKPFEDGLANAFFYGGYLTFIGAILFALKDVSVSLSINNNEVIYRKWVYLSIKTERIALNDVEKIDVVNSMTSGAKLIFLLKNGEKKRVGLFYFKEVVGDVEGVTFGKYAPNDPNLKLGVVIAATISMNSQITFNTVYLENSSAE